MENFRYTLIVSQYRYSRHSFLVKHNPDTFLEQAKALTAELEAYKRPPACDREINYGDLTYRVTDKIYMQYNVNDWGDIYFISSLYANRLMHEAIEYADTSRRERRGYQKKAHVESIGLHHNYNTVEAIVQKHFEIV